MGYSLIVLLAAGVLCADARLWRDIRGLMFDVEAVEVEVNYTEPVIVNTPPPDFMCFHTFGMCGRVVTVPMKPPIINEDGLTFSRNNVDNICSAGSQFIPCLERNMSPAPICDNVRSTVQQMRDLFTFVCVTNRTDVYNLVPCANKKFIQIQVFGCLNEVIGSMKLMYYLKQLEPDTVTTELQKQLACGMMASFKRCTSRAVRITCDKRSEAVVNKVMDIAVSGKLRLPTNEYIDLSTCPGRH